METWGRATHIRVTTTNDTAVSMIALVSLGQESFREESFMVRGLQIEGNKPRLANILVTVVPISP